MMRLLRYLVVLGLAASSVLAEGDGGTRSPFAFGAGARDLSLGGANLAVGDVGTAAVWNASRLNRAEQFTFTGFHSRLYDSDVAYQYLGLVAPTLDYGTFAIGVFRLGVDGIERRDAGNLVTGDFDDSRLQFALAYGVGYSGYDFGLAVTLERHSLDTYQATSSPGLNLSVSRRFTPGSGPVQALALAIQGRNVLQPSIDLAGTSVSYPVALEIGGSAEISPKQDWEQTLTISTALTKVDGVDARFAAGLEYDVHGILRLRGGVRESKLSFGAGIEYAGLCFDYALVDRDLGSLHMFSLTTRFGTAVSERRAERTGRREAEFNALMSDRLAERNSTMVRELVAKAEEQAAVGDLSGAADRYDRAMFLARANDMDTTAIAERRTAISDELNELNRQIRFAAQLDTARTRFDAGDFVGAGYFAAMALAEIPDATDAMELRAAADNQIQLSATREQIIGDRLNRADSLLAYGRIDAALTTARSLAEYAPADERVVRALRRAEFENWRQTALASQAAGDRRVALMALDSALALFPGHQGCLNLRRELTPAVEPEVAPTVAAAPIPEKTMSEDTRRRVESAYATAQSYFTSGDLTGAIKYWEDVERLAPDYQSVREYLVNAYKYVGVELYGQNKLKEAIVYWKKAAGLSPGNAEILSYIERTETEIRKLRELSYEHE